MSSKNISKKQAPSGQRVKLADVLPLKAPLIVQIFDTYTCNLACTFCHYGLEKDKRPKLSTETFMELSVFKKLIDELCEMPEKLKMLRFCGAGESLLNKNIVEFVRYAADKKVSEKMELITNGTLLTPEMSVKLIDAGLERLRVSIYGLSDKKYEEVCRRKVDFDSIVRNVKFFYEEKERKNKNLNVYVKTMDVSLDSEDDKKRFIEIFKDYCDAYAIEQVVPNVQTLDYSKWLDKTPNYNALGFSLPDINVCPQPYHLVTVCPDGRVVPCSNETMTGIGNIREENFSDIWNGAILRQVQQKMLEGSKNYKGVACETCSVVQCRPFPEDILDDHIERLKEIYT